MSKTSASLFVPVGECLFLSLMLHFFGSGFMLSAAPVDFSPLARTVLSAQMWVIVCTTGVHAAISMLDKTLFILGDVRENEVTNMHVSKRKLLSLLRLRASFRRSMDASNACSAAVLTLLLVAATGLAQALWNAGSSGGSSMTTTTNTILIKALRDPNILYQVSQRLSWIQYVMGGASAWTVGDVDSNGKTVLRVQSGMEMPMFGSIFASVVVAALAVLFLLTLYMSYVATPEGESSFSFLDPKGLAAANWIVSSSLSWDRITQFETCSLYTTSSSDPTTTSNLLVPTQLFSSAATDILVTAGVLALTCFHTFIPWPRIGGRDVVGLLISLSICTVQLIYIYFRLPPTAQLVCSVLAVICYVMNIAKAFADDARRPQSLVSASLAMLESELLLLADNEDSVNGPASSYFAAGDMKQGGIVTAPANAPFSSSGTEPAPASDAPSAPPLPPSSQSMQFMVPNTSYSCSSVRGDAQKGALVYRGGRHSQPSQLKANGSVLAKPECSGQGTGVDSMLMLSMPFFSQPQQQQTHFPTPLQQQPPVMSDKFHWA